MTTETHTDNLPGEKIKDGIVLQLPVTLTIEEIATRARGLGDKAAALQKLRDEVAEVNKRGKERIKNAETELDRLMETLRAGAEERLVACHERFHAGTVLTIREDTMDHARPPRPANPQERQIALPGPNGSNGILEQATAAQKQVGFDDDDAENDNEADEPEGDDEPTNADEPGAKPKRRRRKVS